MLAWLRGCEWIHGEGWMRPGGDRAATDGHPGDGYPPPLPYLPPTPKTSFQLSAMGNAIYTPLYEVATAN